MIFESSAIGAQSVNEFRAINRGSKPVFTFADARDGWKRNGVGVAETALRRKALI